MANNTSRKKLERHTLVSSSYCNKKKAWKVVTRYSGKHLVNYFENETLANLWIEVHTNFRAGNRVLVGVAGKDIQLGAAILNMLDTRLANGAITSSSHKTYMDHLRSYFGTDFGTVYLSEINMEYLNRLKESLRMNKGGGESNGTKWNCALILLDLVRNFYQKKREFVSINPELDFADLKIEVMKKPKISFTGVEIEKIYEAYQNTPSKERRKKYALGILILFIETGVRLGELLCLKISHRDIAEQNIFVCETIKTHIKKGLVVGPCKKKSIGLVPLGPHFEDFMVVRENYLISIGRQDLISHDFVFPRMKDQIEVRKDLPLDSSSMRDIIKEACAHAKVRILRTHCAGRVSCATTIAREHKDKNPLIVVKTVQAHLRHKNPEMSYEYIDLAEDAKSLDAFKKQKKAPKLVLSAEEQEALDSIPNQELKNCFMEFLKKNRP